MIAVIAKLKVADGKEGDFEALIAELAKTVLEKEEGCVMYQLCKSQQAGTYVMIERYKDQEAFGVHAQTEHFRAAVARFGEVLAGAPEIEILTEVG
ncbi:MAG: putative quinol monooxygenase [Myxococcales bacterium]|nr:putative quinol monooxygenase [Myxococcales bacterium]